MLIYSFRKNINCMLCKIVNMLRIGFRIKLSHYCISIINIFFLSGYRFRSHFLLDVLQHCIIHKIVHLVTWYVHKYTACIVSVAETIKTVWRTCNESVVFVIIRNTGRFET